MSSISIRWRNIRATGGRASLVKRLAKRKTPSRHPCTIWPMQHSEGFLAIVNAARTGVSEIDLDQACERLSKNPDTILMDVREDIEWSNGHAPRRFTWGKASSSATLSRSSPRKARR